MRAKCPGLASLDHRNYVQSHPVHTSLPNMQLPSAVRYCIKTAAHWNGKPCYLAVHFKVVDTRFMFFRHV